MKQWTDWQKYKKNGNIWNWFTNIPGIPPENLRKTAHPEREISLMSVRKWGNEKTDRHTRHMKLFEINAKMSPEYIQKFDKDSSSITKNTTDNLLSVRKWGNEQTDRQTRNLNFFRTNVQTFLDYL